MSDEVKQAPKYYLTDDDIRHELRAMQRWCRLFHKTDADWVALEAERYRARHPVVRLDSPDFKAA